MTALSSEIQVRPQPCGVFAFPVSLLLLPPSSDTAPLEALLRGDTTVMLRQDWRFYRLALQGRLAEASQAITGQTPIDEFNRFVLQPDAPQYERLSRQLAGELRSLLDCAAYSHGLIDQPGDTASLDGELRGAALVSAAAASLEREDTASALRQLDEALTCARNVSPLLAAQILNQLASLELSTEPARAISRYQEALRLAETTPLESLRAELWMNLGMAYQEASSGRRALLLEAVKAYQEAIRCGLSVSHQPEMYALAHNNLALAYLSIPARDASDQLRMGIAVQSLREALTVFRRDTHPEMWSSAQLNLANALQYLPSSHPEENLRQAVEIYEELLSVRTAALDPLGYARLLANQANALAHLGIFRPALEKLNEAHKLFHWHGEPEMAASALEQADLINQRIEERG